MAILTYDLRLDQFADSKGVYSWTLYPQGTPTPPLPLPPGTTPIDLTGATARFMIRAHPPDSAPVVSITNVLGALGQVVLGGTAGTVTLNLTKAATGLLVGPRGALTARYLYQLFVDFPDGTSADPVGGNVNVTLAVTH